MELKWLEDFLKLYEVRNFGRAADERHVTQPAFSRRIRNLEDWIGAPLFDREKRPLDLTEAGKRFRPIAEELVSRARFAKSGALLPGLPAPRLLEQEARPRVAVPPFVNLKGAESDHSLSAGLADMIALELANSQFALVIERTKTFRAYERDASVEHIAQETGATHVLDGTYVIAGNMAHLTVRLIESASGEVLWSRKFRVDVSDVLSVIDEIGAKIAWTITAVFEQTLALRAPQASHPENMTAFGHFIRGNYILRPATGTA